MVRKYVQSLKHALKAYKKTLTYSEPTLNTIVPSEPGVTNPEQGVNLESARAIIRNQQIKQTPFEGKVMDVLFRTMVSRSNATRNKITIVGASDLAAAAAFTLLAKGVTKEVSMIDVNEEKIKGELLDLLYSSAFLNNAKIQAGKDYAVSAGSDICIIAANNADIGPDCSYPDAVHRNARIIEAIAPQLLNYSPNTILLIASEPVDILAYWTWKVTGLSRGRVFGAGTNLDSARFRHLISQKLDLCPGSCNGYIIGQHGEASVPVWSSVNVAGIRLKDLNPQIGTETDPEDWMEVHKEVVSSDHVVQDLKGNNNWATALSLADICEAILTDSSCVRPLSTYAKGEHAIKDEVFVSLPCVVRSTGITDLVRQPLTEAEAELLRKSAETVAKLQDQIQLIH